MSEWTVNTSSIQVERVGWKPDLGITWTLQKGGCVKVGVLFVLFCSLPFLNCTHDASVYLSFVSRRIYMSWTVVFLDVGSCTHR